MATSLPQSTTAPSVVPSTVPESKVFGKHKARPLFEPRIVKRAIGDAFVKLNPSISCAIR